TGNGTNGNDAKMAHDQTRVPLGRIDHNPYQPRKTFDDDELAGLSASIRTHGILQPLVVRAVGDRYQLVAGERRLRAAQAVGFEEVPVHVVDLNDQQILEAALVENIQRTDLNPIEKAQGFQDYLQRFQMTHEQLASRLGLDRSTVTNLVRLLELSPEVQTAVRVGQISAGHARALLAIPDPERQLALCKEIIARGHSVRTVEALVKEQRSEPTAEAPKSSSDKTRHVQSIEDELRLMLAVRVEIRVKGKDKGQIILGFESNDDFERLLAVLHKPANG
ncbi:MAG TPA: ParB/RepB/Spo0J family partition protein, partial [Gemmataceae bacterium]|nr:ParB/RepB/Spo0J family partition protein [Gemmataceae bacterium]